MIALELIQYLAGSKAFHSVNLKMIVGIQESISSYSLNEISLSDVGYFEKDDECNVYDYEFDEHDRKESKLYDGLINCFEFYFNPTR